MHNPLSHQNKIETLLAMIAWHAGVAARPEDRMSMPGIGCRLLDPFFDCSLRCVHTKLRENNRRIRLPYTRASCWMILWSFRFPLHYRKVAAYLVDAQTKMPPQVGHIHRNFSGTLWILYAIVSRMQTHRLPCCRWKFRHVGPHYEFSKTLLVQ